MIIPDTIAEHAVCLKDQYFDLRGLSVYSSIGVPTLRTYIKTGSLPAYKLRGKLLIRKSEFDAWIQEFRLSTKKDLKNIVDSVMDNLNRRKKA